MLKSGQTFAHFKVIDKLGEGGMGLVYLAEDKKLNRRVALKILHADYFDNPDRLARFIREAKTAAQISHPNVMGIFDLDKAVEENSGSELNYIVMENIDGETLTNYLVDRTPTITELLRLAEKIAAGLAAAHKLGIVHRDIKNDNIKINEDGDPKILDFGLAKPLDTALLESDTDDTGSVTGDLTQEGKILGTVSYMSPEQARGEAVDTRSDIFSFGILMYNMFAGRFPFEADSRVGTLAKILESRQAPMRQANESLPSELERIVDKCLQKNRDDRYQDSRDLVVDLRNLRRRFASGISDSVSSISDLPKTVRSHTFTFWAKYLGITGAILAILAIMFLWLQKDEKSDVPYGLQAKENALAILNFENKTGDESFDWLESGLPEILQTDLAQSAEMNIISRGRLLDSFEKHDKNHQPSYKEFISKAKALGAVKAISGAYYKLGDKIRIDARLEDVETGQIILAEKVVGDDPFVMIDSLTQKIARSLNIKGMMAGKRGVSEMTSSSPEAYKEYIHGMEKFRQNLRDESIEHFERAIAIDSTFALPYLRIGMAHYFRGRQQQSASYFASANRFKDRLPRKEKDLLDIYVDMFLKAKFDEAFTKLTTFVSNYPDDKEIRSIYALLFYQTSQNAEMALAHLDTVLLIDPIYQQALENYIIILSDISENEKAISYAKKFKEYYPKSMTPYNMLSGLYRTIGQYDKAIEENKVILELSPGDVDALSGLTGLCILKRDFDNAYKYAEKIKEHHADDPFQMFGYYNRLITLAEWQGKFREAQSIRFETLKLAQEINDSARIQAYGLRIAGTYLKFDMIDSALYYGEWASKYAVKFGVLAYPFFLIDIDNKYEKRARKLFDPAMSYFRANIPSEIWVLADAMTELFEAKCTADTLAQIKAYEKMLAQPFQQGSDNIYDLGSLLVLSGQPEKGRETLKKLTEGKSVSSNAMRYLPAIYYIGLAEEQLGNTKAAIEKYREVLRYWGSPDIELQVIKDTKTHLQKLAS